jgi:ribose transport system ATP-binding protein
MNATDSIKVSNLSKHYPGVEELKSVSFNIHGGEVHALVGENGAGKSTFIKILSGAVQPDAGGTVTYKGESYAPQTPKEALDKGIATIYQIMNLLPDRSITHNVMLGKESANNGIINSNEMRKATQTVLASLNADYLDPDAEVKGLKVGEKQVVEIAKSLVNESELLIMDEPTAALNQQEMKALFKIIKKLKERGVTIIYVSHRLDEVYELADSVTVLRDGKHILTRPISQVTREELIESMIGRKLENIFPSKKSSQKETILTVENLSAGENLEEIIFSLKRGEVLAITGLSGSGKADLGKALYGAVPVRQGTVTIKNEPIRLSPKQCIQHGIIMLPEDRKEEKAC